MGIQYKHVRHRYGGEAEAVCGSPSLPFVLRKIADELKLPGKSVLREAAKEIELLRAERVELREELTRSRVRTVLDSEQHGPAYRDFHRPHIEPPRDPS